MGTNNTTADGPQRAPTAWHGVRIVVAGSIGNALEWYDFALFGFFAPVIARLFFPAEDRLVGLVQTFGVFALGFLMRPLGGAIFGHLGDRLGRKKALELSVLLMALPTTALGLLPTYAQIGFAAPVLLTLVRLVQGLSVGGELIGSISFLVEYAPPGRRGLLGSWGLSSATLGTLVGSATAAALTALLAADDLARWGWRLPFLAGILVGVVGLWLRHGIDETPCFKEAADAGQTVDSPLRQALRNDRRPLLTTLGVSALHAIAFYLAFVWLSTWLAHINRPRLDNALIANTVALALLVVLGPAAGGLSDRIGRRPVLFAGVAGWGLSAYPVFLLLHQGTLAAALMGQAIFAACAALICGALPAAFVEQFPTAIRYSGIAVSYNLAMAVLGGSAPVLATWLIDETGHALAPAFLLPAAAIVAALAVWAMDERYDQPLS